jgi:hypothetical protein
MFVRWLIDPNALDYGVDLIPPPGTVALLGVVHFAMLHPIISITATSGTN